MTSDDEKYFSYLYDYAWENIANGILEQNHEEITVEEIAKRQEHLSPTQQKLLAGRL